VTDEQSEDDRANPVSGVVGQVPERARSTDPGCGQALEHQHQDGVAAPQLVLGFGNVSEHAIEPAISSVADLMR
jgi:hypothetical protein